MFGDSKRTIRIEWDGDTGYRVLRGFWVKRHDEGAGFVVNGFGWRVDVSVRPWNQRGTMVLLITSMSKSPPRMAQVKFLCVDIWIRPAYSGYLVSKDAA